MPPTPSELYRGVSSSAGMKPWTLSPVESVRYRPTVPLEFASPSGNDADFELRSRRADSQQLADSTTTRARTWCSVIVPVSM